MQKIRGKKTTHRCRGRGQEEEGEDVGMLGKEKVATMAFLLPC